MCAYFIDKLSLRVGNEKDITEEADTVGCCSLRIENIQFAGDDRVTLDFIGKDSMRYCNTVEVDQLVYAHLIRFCENKESRENIFCQINSLKLNEFLKEKSGMVDLSAKVFRTYNASETL